MITQLIRGEKIYQYPKGSGRTDSFVPLGRKTVLLSGAQNDEALGVLIPNHLWEDMIEDMEALSSPNYLARIAKARKSKKNITPMEQIEKELGHRREVYK